MACVYCWNQGGTYGKVDDCLKMTPNIVRKGIELLIKESNGSFNLVVDFCGAEPLLNMPVLKETILYCKELSKRNNIKFSFLLATNGLLLNEDNAKWLFDQGVNVVISIDGTKEVQDKQRPLPDGSSSFDVIIKNLSALPQEIVRNYVARATITPSGPGAFETYKMLRELGFKRIEVFESEPACFGMPYEYADLFYLKEEDIRKLHQEYEELLTLLIHKVAEGELEYQHLFFTRMFKQMARLIRNGDFEGPCAAGLGQIAIDTEGFCYPCTGFLGQKEWRIGHIHTGLNEKLRQYIKKCNILDSEQCKNCWARNLCLGSGSCFNLNSLNNKRIDHPVPRHCELYRFKIELLIAELDKLQNFNPQKFDELFAEGHFEDRTAWSPFKN